VLLREYLVWAWFCKDLLWRFRLREFRITPKGLWVGEKLKGITGLLSGTVRPWEHS